jgi:hypothetical protein
MRRTKIVSEYLLSSAHRQLSPSRRVSTHQRRRNDTACIGTLFLVAPLLASSGVPSAAAWPKYYPGHAASFSEQLLPVPSRFNHRGGLQLDTRGADTGRKGRYFNNSETSGAVVAATFDSTRRSGERSEAHASGSRRSNAERHPMDSIRASAVMPADEACSSQANDGQKPFLRANDWVTEVTFGARVAT